ncbi:radical SAM protein [Acinetobacter sp. VNH17]|uniref:Radical SAM protein n=1 Tax=Acinetobacter thutiue TaxID=2998078 RepID=A0ABT7WM24_9GAMM|nr:radical SAM protein [Acinetobacter thutiue]MCY6411623.1 radical SAM protein [Acinetobacter thutiue]MDN0013725.1 radical SAM protein [Acinetobacter thutiue]
MQQVYLIITKKCNLSCSFCIRDYNYNVDGNLSISDFDLIIERFKSYGKVSNFIISGGEPTVHKNFNYFLEKACENFNTVTINSNGTNKYWATQKFLDIVKKHKVRIQFSIDGAEEVHDAIRGKGSYQKTLNNIRLCSEYPNATLIISTTVASSDFIKKFNILYTELNPYISKWDVKRVSYSGEASAENFDYLTNEKWNEIVDYVKQHDDKNLVNIHKMYDFDILYHVSDEQINIMQSRVVKNCGSGTSKIYIYPNLDVLACTCYEKHPSGNLKDMDIKSILSSAQHRKIVEHEIDDPVCNSCRYKKICNGGCLGAGFYSTGSLNVADMKCPKVYSTLKERIVTTKLIDFVQV